MTLATSLSGRMCRRAALLFAIAALAVVLTGLARFVHLMTGAGESVPHADGIVAFTGGPERVETALRLMAGGRADRLLLSGIGGGAELAELAQRAGVDPLPMAGRITIDRDAATTHDNAVQTAAWARANGIRSLLVVTSTYHMPRAVTELARALPDATLYPLPVSSPNRNERATPPLRLMAEEYIKFLASAAGLTAVLPAREPSRGGHAG